MDIEQNTVEAVTNRGKKGVILLVEGTSVSTEIEQQIYASGGYRVDLAKNKKDAVAKLSRGEQYDVLIADWNSLARTGPDLLNILKTRFRSIKIIIVNCNAPEVKKLMFQGVAGILPQPIHWESFVGHLIHVTNDQRRSHRFTCRPLACRLHKDDGTLVGCGSIKDISADGVMLQTEYMLPDDTHVAIEIFLPDGRALKVAGQVIRTIKSDSWQQNYVPIYFHDERNLDLLFELSEYLKR